MSDFFDGDPADGEPMTKLSDRIRPDCEAAPWVCREIKKLEKRIAELEDKLHRIEQWCNAYPRTVFIEPTKKQWAEANKVLEAHKPDCPSLTAISGSNMRHVVEGIAKIAALNGVESDE